MLTCRIDCSAATKLQGDRFSWRRLLSAEHVCVCDAGTRRDNLILFDFSSID